MIFKVELAVVYKPNVLNPQEKVISDTLKKLGYNFESLRQGRYVSYETNLETEDKARAQAKEISDKLLANFNLETHKVLSITKLEDSV